MDKQSFTTKPRITTIVAEGKSGSVSGLISSSVWPALVNVLAAGIKEGKGKKKGKMKTLFSC